MKVLWAQAFVFLLFCSKVCGFEQISRVCVCVWGLAALCCLWHNCYWTDKVTCHMSQQLAFMSHSLVCVWFLYEWRMWSVLCNTKGAFLSILNINVIRSLSQEPENTTKPQCVCVCACACTVVCSINVCVCENMYSIQFPAQRYTENNIYLGSWNTFTFDICQGMT